MIGEDRVSLPTGCTGFLVVEIDSFGRLRPTHGTPYLTVTAERDGGPRHSEDGTFTCNRTTCPARTPGKECQDCGIRGVHYWLGTACRHLRLQRGCAETAALPAPPNAPRFAIAAVRCDGNVCADEFAASPSKPTFYSERTTVRALFPGRSTDEETQRRCQLAATRYNVTLCATRRELQDEARRHGRLVPLSLQPRGRARRLLYGSAPSSRIGESLEGAARLTLVPAAIMACGLITVGGFPVAALLAAALLIGFIFACAVPLICDIVERQRHSTLPGERFWQWSKRRRARHAGDQPDQNPHYPVTVIGYRRWTLGFSGELGPVGFSGGSWEQGRNVACCRLPGSSHEAPAAGCHCGFNSYDWITDAEYNYPGSSMISGAMIAGGQIRAHSTGFRAEYAAIIGLLEPDSYRVDAARLAAARYGVPLVKTRAELARLAHSTGAVPLTRKIRPKPTAATLTEQLAASVPGWARDGARQIAMIVGAGLLTLGAMIRFPNEPLQGVPLLVLGLAGAGLLAALLAAPVRGYEMLMLWRAHR